MSGFDGLNLPQMLALIKAGGGDKEAFRQGYLGLWDVPQEMQMSGSPQQIEKWVEYHVLGTSARARGTHSEGKSETGDAA